MFQASFPLTDSYKLVMVWIWGCYTTEIRRQGTDTSHGFPLLLSGEEHASPPYGHGLFQDPGNSFSLRSRSTSVTSFSHHGAGWVFLLFFHIHSVLYGSLPSAKTCRVVQAERR